MARPTKKKVQVRAQQKKSKYFHALSSSDDGSAFEICSDDGLSDSEWSENSEDSAVEDAHKALKTLYSTQLRKYTRRSPDHFAPALTGFCGVYTGNSRTTQWRKKNHAKDLAASAQDSAKINSFFQPLPKKRPRSSSPVLSISSDSASELDNDLRPDELIKLFVDLLQDQLQQSLQPPNLYSQDGEDSEWMDEEDVDLPTEEAESSKDGSLSHQNSESGGGEYDDDNNNSDDDAPPAPSAMVIEAREILAEETS
ncbi:hypothetical protein FISHEDRAFT_77368, partial [Fistulina hepatica ATCC 64428]